MSLERPPVLPPELEHVKKRIETAPPFTYSLDDLREVAQERDIALSAKDVEGFYVEMVDDLATKADRYLEIEMRHERLREMRHHQPTREDEIALYERVGEARTKLHDAFMSNFDSLIRHLGGKYATWYRSALGSNRDIHALWAEREALKRWLEKEPKTYE